MSADDVKWRKAFEALMIREDIMPLAALFRGSAPIPTWLRQELAELFDPLRALLIGEYALGDGDVLIPTKETELAQKDADRLVFVRTDRARRTIRTFAERVAAGVAVMEKKANGKSHKMAIEEVAKEHKRSVDYVEHSVQPARDLPAALRPSKK